MLTRTLNYEATLAETGCLLLFVKVSFIFNSIQKQNLPKALARAFSVIVRLERHIVGYLFSNVTV